MTEYLEKAALVRILRAKAEMGRLSEYSVCFDNVAKMIELLPAADVEEVKHGKWIEVQKENIWNDIVPVLECSACGKYTDVPIVLEGLDWTMKPATAPTAEQRWIWRTKL